MKHHESKSPRSAILEVVRQCQELSGANTEQTVYAEALSRRLIIPADDIEGAERVMTVSLQATPYPDERYLISAELSRDLVYEELARGAQLRLEEQQKASRSMKEIIIPTGDMSIDGGESTGIEPDGYRYVWSTMFQVDPIEETVLRSVKEAYCDGDVELFVGEISEDEIGEAPSEFMAIVDLIREEYRMKYCADCLGALALLQCHASPQDMSRQLFPYQG